MSPAIRWHVSCTLEALEKVGLTDSRLVFSLTVLDDDLGSRLCALMALVCSVTLVVLEAARELPMPSARISLALSTGMGILLTCCVRESHHKNGHRLCAVLAFGSSVLLVLLVAALAGSAMDAALALLSGLFLTGLAQGVNVIADACCEGCMPLPSWALGALEIGLVAGFGFCMAQHKATGNILADHCRSDHDVTFAVSKFLR